MSSGGPSFTLMMVPSLLLNCRGDPRFFIHRTDIHDTKTDPGLSGDSRAVNILAVEQVSVCENVTPTVATTFCIQVTAEVHIL